MDLTTTAVPNGIGSRAPHLLLTVGLPRKLCISFSFLDADRVLCLP